MVDADRGGIGPVSVPGRQEGRGANAGVAYPRAHPYRIDPGSPWYNVLNVSGGRSSAYMLGQVLMEHGGELPDWCEAIFANTGRERAETLDFVQGQSSSSR